MMLANFLRVCASSLFIFSSGWAESQTTPLAEALAAAGSNRPELEKALEQAPEQQREGVRFLIENMPPVDLVSIKAGFLLAHVDQSYRAMAYAPWAGKVPKEIFLNDVLPYSSLNERRDNGRSQLREISFPLVKSCLTPGEAALELNRTLFKHVKVRYSTKREKPDQSALESMQSGLASCSGLSILLVDACRSVGIPARVVGTPLWTNMRGNHTWVEIWDGGWHFLGAAEPSAEGLDHGWFKGDAAKADPEKPIHWIYASSFRKTGLSFPLVWNPSIDWVHAVNVTDHYTAPRMEEPKNKVQVMIRVVDQDQKTRVAAKVTVRDLASGAVIATGTSRDESADLNDLLTFLLDRHVHYRIDAVLDEKKAQVDFTVSSLPVPILSLSVKTP